MLKKGKFILITFVIISIVFAFNTYINQRENTRLADQIFITSLSEATTGFGVDYSKMNEDGKIFYYLKISSNLNTAMNTLDLTSYKHIKTEMNYLRQLIIYTGV